MIRFQSHLFGKETVHEEGPAYPGAGFSAASPAAVASPYVITSTALGNADTPPASERVAVGHIGVGGQGRWLLRSLRQCKGAQSVAVADAYKDRREGLARAIKGKAYGDFRELLARSDIDAVIIATPDHWHVPIAIAAARAKKDAYVEKPLGVSIEQDLACLQGVYRTPADFPVRHLAAQLGPLPIRPRTGPQRPPREDPHDRGDCAQRRRGRIDASGPRPRQPRLRHVVRTVAGQTVYGRSLPSAGNLLDLRLFDRLPGRLGRPSAGHHGLGQRRRHRRPDDGRGDGRDSRRRAFTTPSTTGI